MSDIKVDLDNLTKVERETLLSLVKKANNPEPPIWLPEAQNDYYSVNKIGSVQVNTKISESAVSLSYGKVGNIFKTRELAERMAERRKRTGIFENKMMEFADGYEFRENSSNHYVFYAAESREWKSRLLYYSIDPLTIFMSKGSAEKAIRWANKHFPDGL